MQHRHIHLPILFLFGIAIFSVYLAISTGSIHITPAAFYQALFKPVNQHLLIYQQIILELRLPRATSAFVSGGLLALAGALMQVLLRNPLADPYILGISSGAAFANLGSMLIGLSGFWLSGSTLLGALITMLLVFFLARAKNHWRPTRLLLTGVIVAAGFSAANTFILTLTSNNNLKQMLFWLIGDLSTNKFPGSESVILVIGLCLSLLFARQLNLLTRGELAAEALGVNTKPLRLQMYFLSSLLTACAVTIAGPIGFVGLVIPHIIRLAFGSDYRMLLPASVLAGGALLTFADTIARVIIAPGQIPVGVITAFLGVPIFLLLLQKNET